MSTQTTNYKLIKPELTDAANITKMNTNWDKIDTELKQRAVLDSNGVISKSQLPDLDYVPNTEKGNGNGVATLDSTGQVPANQLDNIFAKLTGGASTILTSNLPWSNRVLISNASGKVEESDITSTELGYLDGVTSNIQTQLNTKVSKAGDTMTGDLKTTGKFTLQHNSSGRSAELWTAAGTGAALVFYDSDTEGGGRRSLKLNGILGAENPNLDNAIQFAQTINGATQYHVVLTSANAASRIQSLLQGGSISVVKSVQRGTVAAGKTESGTITITSVNMNKAFVNLVGTSDGHGSPVQLKLSSATSIAWERSYIYGAGTNFDYSGFSWEVIEFY